MDIERFGEGRASQSHKVIKSGRRPGSTLPPETQAVVADHLRAGLTISETARRLGLSREQVRTVKYALHGLTLAEARALKRELRS